MHLYALCPVFAKKKKKSFVARSILLKGTYNFVIKLQPKTILQKDKIRLTLLSSALVF